MIHVERKEYTRSVVSLGLSALSLHRRLVDFVVPHNSRIGHHDLQYTRSILMRAHTAGH